MHLKNKTAALPEKEDLLVDLTFHEVPASILTEFVEKIVRPCYKGNLNVALQDVIYKAITERDFVLSHVTHVQNSVKA